MLEHRLHRVRGLANHLLLLEHAQLDEDRDRPPPPRHLCNGCRRVPPPLLRPRRHATEGRRALGRRTRTLLHLSLHALHRRWQLPPGLARWLRARSGRLRASADRRGQGCFNGSIQWVDRPNRFTRSHGQPLSGRAANARREAATSEAELIGSQFLLPPTLVTSGEASLRGGDASLRGGAHGMLVGGFYS
eukprot:scaffold75792_cov65-Phaeocystis_antarctica.AAC.9